MNLIDLVGIFNPTKPLLGKDELKHDKDYDCIVISIKDQLVGLLVRQILDISLSELEIDTHSVGREEILGTFFLNNRLVNLIQPYIILDSLGLKNVKNLHIEASLSGKKILVIDDSLMYRKLSEEAVKDLGANVKTAIDGFDAIEMCRKEKFDLILTDIEMPRMDGYEFCRQLRHLKNDYINTPVIAVSTKVSEQDKLKGREAGFNSHLEKFRKDDVIREVQKYLIL
jgi:two-component system chemotaxis sensor kinase CheA